MTSIAVLAEREAEAEARKGKADMDWRKAWWETTAALGQEEGRAAVGDAQRIVREITGQSKQWISDRTRTGRKFASLKAYDTLPPRMAVEVAKSGVEITDEVAEQMLTAEQDKVSLRDFTESLTGRGWADTPGGMSEETIARIVRAQPEAVAQAVAESPAARRGVGPAIDRVLTRENPTTLGPPPRTPEGKATEARLQEVNDAEREISLRVYRASTLLREAREVYEQYAAGLGSEEQVRVKRICRDIVVDAEALSMSLDLDETTGVSR